MTLGVESSHLSVFIQFRTFP